MNNQVENIKKRVELVGKILKVSPQKIRRIQTPEKVIEKKISYLSDTGKMKTVKAFRVQHTSVRGPYKGGVRYHNAVTLPLIKSLAFEMGLKCAVAGLPLGGGKGGIVTDPKKLSRKELYALSYSYGKDFSENFGPRTDIPAPDVGTDSFVIDAMVDGFRASKTGSKLTENEVLATFTGKSIEKGGSFGRPEATGRGGLIVLKALMRKGAFVGIKSSKPTIAIQGFGNAGSVFATLAEKAGFSIIAVGDSVGGVLSVGGVGLNIKKLSSHKKHTGTVQNFPKTTNIGNDELLKLPVDVLVPAALGDVITRSNASEIRAKCILELANGPTDIDADEILKKRAVTVIPDILANAGGVTVSYLESLQNLNGGRWTEDKVNVELTKIMKKAVSDVLVVINKYRTDFRTAAYLLAVSRLI